MCCENLRAELTLERHSFSEAKAELQRLRLLKDSIKNAAGDMFMVSAQSLGKVLSYKARAKSLSADSHYAAVAGLEKLLRRSKFLYAEKPRNHSADIQAYNKYGTPFIFDGQIHLAKITAKSYASVTSQIVYSVESLNVKKIGARGITETITNGQSLDSDTNLAKRVTDFLSLVNLLEGGNFGAKNSPTAPVTGLNMGGSNHAVKIIVSVKNSKSYCDHDLTPIEKGNLIDSLHLLSNKVAASEASLSCRAWLCPKAVSPFTNVHSATALQKLRALRFAHDEITNAGGVA